MLLFTFTSNPVYAFDRAVLGSVVSVLPNWKQHSTHGRKPDAPEGTAIAILQGGYLMTNAHVLGNAEKVDIRLNDGKLLAVEIVGRDLKTDLALLKSPMDFTLLQPASTPDIGSKVCSVGNQFGLGLSVTCGVVSASHRTGTGFNLVEDFIQTDAVINPGGSGGALVNKDGHLVGMISAIFTKGSDANIGVNFASSIELVTRVAQDLRDHGRVLWGRAGFKVGALSPDERRQWSGGKVIFVNADGSAGNAGLKIGDVINQVGERNIIKPTDVVSAIALYRIGDSVQIGFLRDGQPRHTTITLVP